MALQLSQVIFILSTQRFAWHYYRLVGFLFIVEIHLTKNSLGVRSATKSVSFDYLDHYCHTPSSTDRHGDLDSRHMIAYLQVSMRRPTDRAIELTRLGSVVVSTVYCVIIRLP